MLVWICHKTGSLNNSICVFNGISQNDISLSNYLMLYKYGKFIVCMCNLVFKTIIAFTLVGYEVITTNSMIHASLAIYHQIHILPLLME